MGQVIYIGHGHFQTPRPIPGTVQHQVIGVSSLQSTGQAPDNLGTALRTVNPLFR